MFDSIQARNNVIPSAVARVITLPAEPEIRRVSESSLLCKSDSIKGLQSC